MPKTEDPTPMTVTVTLELPRWAEASVMRGLSHEIDTLRQAWPIRSVTLTSSQLDSQPTPPPVADRAARTALHELAMAINVLAATVWIDDQPVAPNVRAFLQRTDQIRSKLEEDGE